MTLAQQVTDPFSLSFALCFVAALHQFRREGRATMCRSRHSPRDRTGLCVLGGVRCYLARLALPHQGQAQDGIAQLRQGLTAYRATGGEIGRPYLLALLAEAYGTIGQPEAGLTVLAEALTVVDKTGARFYEPELYRLKGELLLPQSEDNQAEAETCFQQAMAIALNQQAKSLELRAATSLARLWQRQGKRAEARQVLGDV